jgi:hypothetical protein
MNSAADRQTGGVDPDSVLLDVSEWTFDALIKEDSAFARALRRLMRETHSDDDLYAAFGNFVPDPPDPTAVAVPNA